jgi:hypothetical protein
MTTESIILIRFADAGRAYQAFSELRHLDAGLGSLDIRSAALLQRRDDGTLHMPEYDNASAGSGLATGGLVVHCCHARSHRAPQS